MHCCNGITTILFMFLSVLHQTKGSSLDTATVSITADLAYGIEPACVQDCLFDFHSVGNYAQYFVASLGCTRYV